MRSTQFQLGLLIFNSEPFLCKRSVSARRSRGRDVVRLDNVVQIASTHFVVPADAMDLVVPGSKNRLDQFPDLFQTKPGQRGKEMMLGVEIEVEYEQFAEYARITAGTRGSLLLPNI